MDDHDDSGLTRYERMMLRRLTSIGVVLILWAAMLGFGIFYLAASIDANTRELRDVEERLEQFPPGSGDSEYGDEYD